VFKDRDKGRVRDTKSESDTYIFKVQQLRNVAVTPPYFHDGSVAELGDAVRIMGKLQLGRDLTDADVSDLIAFLQSLTGEVPATFAAAPSLPAAAYKY
jgi:cytochrome c peroxidase